MTVLSKYAALSRAVDVFVSANSSKGDIEKLGEKAILVIYGCTSSLTLNDTRVARFLQRVATSTQYVSPEKLPPTSDAAALHSHRTYHQVQTWYGRDIPAGEWGWKQSPTGLVPIRMNQAAAPETCMNLTPVERHDLQDDMDDTDDLAD